MNKGFTEKELEKINQALVNSPNEDFHEDIKKAEKQIKKTGIKNAIVKTEESVINDILKNPDLWNLIDSELDKSIEGEKRARKVIFFVFNMRNVQNLNKSTDNLMVNDTGGTGKDYVVNSVFKLIPDKEKEKRVRISPKVLTYLNDEKNNPEGWIKKCLYLEDLPNTVLNDDAFKVMTSADNNGHNKISIVVNNLIKNNSIFGKPSIIITIAQASPKQEILRRFPILNLDSGTEQTKAILKKQSLFAERGEIQEYDKNIKRALSRLKRINVKIPYASQLAEIFPSENVIIRTHYTRFLDYIKSSCALYQYQRETDFKGNYIAVEQDYQIARELITETTSNNLMIPLTKLQKQILEKIETLAKESLENKEFTFEDLYKRMNNLSGESWIRKNIDKLVEFGFLSKSETRIEGISKPIKVYSLLGVHKLELPEFKDLIKNNPNNKNSKNSKNNPNSPNSLNTTKTPELAYLDNLDYLDKIYTPSNFSNLKISELPIIYQPCSKCGLDSGENRLLDEKSYCPLCLKEKMKERS